jgi:rhodanese-related sulfurtransferase
MLALVLGLSACGRPPEEAPTSPPPVVLPQNYQSLSPAQVETLMKQTKNLGILDTRQYDEMRNGLGWIPGSQSCSWLDGNQSKLQGLDRNQPWLVYCTIGGRAELTAQAMSKLGFKEVYLLKGGFAEWLAQGKAVVR